LRVSLTTISHKRKQILNLQHKQIKNKENTTMTPTTTAAATATKWQQGQNKNRPKSN